MEGIVKLGKARKARDKAQAVQRAAENRARHGRTAAQKARDALAQRRREALLDGSAMNAPPTGGEPGTNPKEGA